MYVYFLKVSFCFNFQASISSLEITDISSYLGLGCTSFPFCLELAVISPVLSHEMWIFLTLIFAVIWLLSGYFCLGFLWWSKSAKDPNSELQWNWNLTFIWGCIQKFVIHQVFSFSSMPCFTSEVKDQAPNLTVLQGKRDLECQVFFSLNNNITASNSITRTVILPLLLSGRNWSVLCSCSDVSIHLCLAFNGPICTALVSQCLRSWSIWVERFLTWELHSHSSARGLCTEWILCWIGLWVASCFKIWCV